MWEFSMQWTWNDFDSTHVSASMCTFYFTPPPPKRVLPYPTLWENVGKLFVSF